MLLQFLGHACFRITLSGGRIILIDPYEPGGLSGRLRYRPVETTADLVLVSHDHRDHCDLSWVGGDPMVVRSGWQDQEVVVEGFEVAHDEFGGRLRGGLVTLFVLRAEGLTLVHCGDLGERLLPSYACRLGAVDVLMVPVGGYYTLGPEGAAELVRQISPRYAVPCHYRTAACDLPELSGVDSFLRRFRSGRWPGTVVEAEQLDPGESGPDRPTVVVLRALGLPGIEVER